MSGMRRLCSALLFVVSERIVLNLLRYEGWNYLSLTMICQHIKKYLKKRSGTVNKYK